MPRIICTVTNDLNYDQRMIRICSTLSSAGYEVLLVGRKKKISQPLQNQPFEQRRLQLIFEKGKLFYLEFNLRLFFFLLFKKFDVVCAVDLDTLVPAVAVGKLKGKKIVFDAHEYFSETPEVVHRPNTKWIWEKVADLSIPQVDAAYTVGSQLAAIFEILYKKPFGVIRNLPFSATHKPETKADSLKIYHQKIILYQGALNEGRGLEALLEAMPSIPGATLWLAGEGDLSDKLRLLAYQLGLGERVKFWGYVLPKDLKFLTEQATVAVNLIENRGMSYFYSLANKAFDYIQFGVPSLQMNFPEYAALNEKYNIFLLLHKLSPDSIALKINSLLQDESAWKKLRANCFAAAQALNWEREAPKLLTIYANLFGSAKVLQKL